MAKYYNTSIAKDVQRIFNFKAADTLGSDVGSMIVPTMEILRICKFIKSNQITNATTGTITTTPTDKDTYLTAIHLGYIKDVTSTAISCTIRVTIDGVVTPILVLPMLSLTVGMDNVTMSFPVPILIDRGTPITLTASTNVANISVNGSAIGYYQEVQSAQ